MDIRRCSKAELDADQRAARAWKAQQAKKSALPPDAPATSPPLDVILAMSADTLRLPVNARVLLLLPLLIQMEALREADR
jgi:hypothetical protein